jgi:hypothetical protein
MRYGLITLTVALYLVIGCTHDAPTTNTEGTSISSVAKRPVPFRGTVRGGGPPPAPSAACGGLLLTELTGEGVATHLGRFTVVQSHCLNPATFTFTGGVITWTAANGDELHGTYSGSLAPTPDPIILQITGAFEFSGGTGRLANATGSGSATGPLDVTTGNFTLALDGTIAY